MKKVGLILATVAALSASSIGTTQAEIICPGFVIASGTHFVTLTYTNGKTRTYPIIKDEGTVTTVLIPHGKMMLNYSDHPSVTWMNNRDGVTRQDCK
jgi:hypothetical protein